MPHPGTRPHHAAAPTLLGTGPQGDMPPAHIAKHLPLRIVAETGHIAVEVIDGGGVRLPDKFGEQGAYGQLIGGAFGIHFDHCGSPLSGLVIWTRGQPGPRWAGEALTEAGLAVPRLRSPSIARSSQGDQVFSATLT